MMTLKVLRKGTGQVSSVTPSKAEYLEKFEIFGLQVIATLTEVYFGCQNPSFHIDNCSVASQTWPATPSKTSTPASSTRTHHSTMSHLYSTLDFGCWACRVWGLPNPKAQHKKSKVEFRINKVSRRVDAARSDFQGDVGGRLARPSSAAPAQRCTLRR